MRGGALDGEHTYGWWRHLSDPISGNTTRALPFTANRGVTGIGNTGWQLHLDAYGGVPSVFELNNIQVRRGRFVIIALRYPPGAVVSSIQNVQLWFGGPVEVDIP